jgi:hypothetical protein
MAVYTYKSLQGTFPRPLTAADDRQYPRFKKTWKQIIEDLRRELHYLDCRDGSCVIMTAHQPYDVRNDGELRRGVRAPEHPGVVIKFDSYDYTARRWAPMSFECDRFTNYEANVQAIVGAMEALRKIERYGVSSRGKQNAHYDGYKALPSAEGKIGDIDVAVEFISEHSGVPADQIRQSPEARTAAFRKAAAKLHPDGGGSNEQFSKLTDARRFMEQL